MLARVTSHMWPLTVSLEQKRFSRNGDEGEERTAVVDDGLPDGIVGAVSVDGAAHAGAALEGDALAGGGEGPLVAALLGGETELLDYTIEKREETYRSCSQSRSRSWPRCRCRTRCR